MSSRSAPKCSGESAGPPSHGRSGADPTSMGGHHEEIRACRDAVGAGDRPRRGTGHHQLAASGDQPRDGRPDERGHHRIQRAASGGQFRAAVPRERGLQGQADDAAAVRRRAGHRLQLGRRRARRAGQGGRAARHRRRRLGRGQDQHRSGRRRRLHPRRQALRPCPARFPGRVLVQQGAVRQGRPRRGDDEHLGRLPRRRQEAAGRRHHADRARWQATSGRRISTGRIWS